MQMYGWYIQHNGYAIVSTLAVCSPLQIHLKLNLENWLYPRNAFSSQSPIPLAQCFQVASAAVNVSMAPWSRIQSSFCCFSRGCRLWLWALPHKLCVWAQSCHHSSSSAALCVCMQLRPRHLSWQGQVTLSSAGLVRCVWTSGAKICLQPGKFWQ